MTIEPTAPPKDKETLPALFQHCCDVYAAMLREATKQEYQENGETKYAIVYKGFLTKLLTDELRLAVPYYTTIRSALKKMGCIDQIRRGGSTSPSEWRLFHEPTEELFRTKVHRAKTKAAKSQYEHRMNQMEDMLANLNRQVQEHERLLLGLREEEQDS